MNHQTPIPPIVSFSLDDLTINTATGQITCAGIDEGTFGDLTIEEMVDLHAQLTDEFGPFGVTIYRHLCSIARFCN